MQNKQMSISHFNTAGAGLLPATAVRAMHNYFLMEHKLGAYETENKHDLTLTIDIYRNVARLLSCLPEEVALFDSGTRAWVTAVNSMPWREGGRVIISPYEYAGNYMAIKLLQRRFGFQIEIMPLETDGTLDLDWLSGQSLTDVQLVSATHIASGCGVTNDICSIGNIIKNSNCFYFVDACQSVGLLHIDVMSIRCDVLTAAGRKFLCGPRGTGMAYFSKKFKERAENYFTDLHAANFSTVGEYFISDTSARRFEFAERNNASLVGLNEAVKLNLDGSSKIENTIYRKLLDGLVSLDNIQVISPGNNPNGIISFIPKNIDSSLLVSRLSQQGINCWVGNGAHTPIYMLSRGIFKFVRISVHYYNDDLQVERLLQKISSYS